MKRDRVAPDDEELGAGLVQRYEHIAEIIGEIDHLGGLGTNTHGI